METAFVTCVICPKGCGIKVDWELCDDGSKKVVGVFGNSCTRGLKYATAEVVHPERVLTSTVRLVNDGDDGHSRELVPIRSASPILKESLMAAMEEISKKTIRNSSVKMGDVVIEDIAGTGVAMVACRDSAI